MSGPPVTRPVEKGLGTELMERGPATKLAGSERLSYKPRLSNGLRAIFVRTMTTGQGRVNHG